MSRAHRNGGVMKAFRQLLSFSMALLVSGAAFGGTKKPAASFPAEYIGGSVPLRQNHSVRAVVAGGEIVIVQHGRQLSVPVRSISRISCATDVRRRFGAAVLGRVPLVDLNKVQTYYVGLTWTDDARPGANHEVLFKLNAGEYRDFVAALERLTGKQAVDTRKTPTVVHYDL
jgi:hypothetical protein